jgi:hypothetical protein
VSFPCPHCGGEIVPVPGSAPFPGWRNPPQIPPQSASNPGANLASSAGIAHGFEVQDLNPSPKKGRTYNQTYTRNFEEFWAVVPLKRGKLNAFKAWQRAVKRLTSTTPQTPPQAEAQILAGMIRYRDDPNRLDEFTKYAEGWLGRDGWEDAPLPSRLPRGVEPAAPKPMHDDDYRRLLEDR